MLLEEAHDLLSVGDVHLALDFSPPDLRRASTATGVGKGDHHIGPDTPWQFVGDHGKVVGARDAVGPSQPSLHDLVAGPGQEEPDESSFEDARFDRQ